ncbi:MAG: hypothetical protein MRJ65_08195 [Candidatus Brocadiaceae bacterium]|nr:hypothetical protein [Candidatus Brocadiaceae bacterium]
MTRPRHQALRPDTPTHLRSTLRYAQIGRKVHGIIYSVIVIKTSAILTGGPAPFMTPLFPLPDESVASIRSLH